METPAQHAPTVERTTGGAGAFADLRRAVTLHRTGPDTFEGTPLPVRWGVTYGGLLVAQAFAAATANTPERLLPRSLHCYFVGTGNSDLPVQLTVTRQHDSRSSAWRSVEIRQQGALVLTAEAMFSVERAGPSHQVPMPPATTPDHLPNVGEVLRPFAADAFQAWDHDSAFDMRYATDHPRVEVERGGPGNARSQVWLRAGGPARVDPRTAAVLLSYASDMCMLDAALRPAGLWFGTAGPGAASGLSLDHSMWFHAPVDLDDWILLDLRSPGMTNGRGLGLADLYSRSGQLLCSVAQLGSIRPLQP